jgi:hypothetical protein
MEIIIALKFEADEDDIGPRLGNRNSGDIKDTLRKCVAHIIKENFKESNCVKFICAGLVNEIGGNK